MIFISAEHRDFYVEQFATGGVKNDCYHRALVYTLGICDDTRCRFSEIYDREGHRIISETINCGWQTSGSLKVTRLAFNLFTDITSTAYGDDGSKDFVECSKYSVSDIFCSPFAAFFMQAIAIRYPDYLSRLSFPDNGNPEGDSFFYDK